MYDIQHCFICRPSDSTVSENAGTVATTALQRSNHSARSHPPIIECCIALYVYLLILGYISDGEEAGYEPELGMIEYDELGVGQEAVVALVGQARAVLLAVLHHITESQRLRIQVRIRIRINVKIQTVTDSIGICRVKFN